MNCELCTADAGKYDMTQVCCQHRFIAAMPSVRRASYYEQVLREQGKEAANALIREVNIVQQRNREKRNAG